MNLQTFKVKSKSELETGKLAKKILNKFPGIKTFCLYGELGSGKTVFVKALGKNLGLDSNLIKSPTYVLCHQYKTKKGPVFHLDLYRLSTSADIASLGFNDIEETKNRWLIIEWADRLGQNLPTPRLDIIFEPLNENSRHITVTHHQ